MIRNKTDQTSQIITKFISISATSACMNTIFTQNIGTPYLLTTLGLLICLKTAGCVANSVDPDQMPHFAASDQGLHCLLTGLSVQILRVHMVVCFVIPDSVIVG